MATTLNRKSMLGKQSSSSFRSAPEYGFGTAERAQLNSKLFVSKDMVSDKFGVASPGPVYAPKAVDGRFHSAPSHSFGASHRYAFASMKRSGAPVPGPGQYTMPGSVSKQHDSQKYSYSSWKFGTSTRADQAKVFVSPAHAKSVTEFIDSPGPCAYGHKGSLNNQIDSRKTTNESFVSRPPHSLPSTDPASQPCAARRSYPSSGGSRVIHPQGMGTSDRFFYENSGQIEKGAPGPGTYTLKPSHGRQVTSTKQTLPITSFPRADRDRTATTVYLGPRQQLAFWGRNSPGPAVYSPTASVGAQVSSEKPNVPKFGFGTADRFAYINIGQRAMQSPGPGSYSI